MMDDTLWFYHSGQPQPRELFDTRSLRVQRTYMQMGDSHCGIRGSGVAAVITADETDTKYCKVTLHFFLLEMITALSLSFLVVLFGLFTATVSEIWVAKCNTLQFYFDRSNQIALLYLNSTIGYLQVGKGVISFDDGVALRAALDGNSLGFDSLPLTEIELHSSQRSVNLRYRNPSDGSIAVGTYCSAVISGQPTTAPTKRPVRSPTRRPSPRRPTRRPSPRRPTRRPSPRRPTRRPSPRKPTRKPSRKPSRRPSKRPSKKPTKRPANPTTKPVIKPTGTPIEAGTYITSDQSSEIVVIPQPPQPTIILSSSRTNCPHLNTTNLFDWHSNATWGGSGVPLAGMNVTLPANKRILISENVTGTLSYITIPSTSELILGENVQGGIHLHVKGIDVQGKLTIGSETCRIETPVSITLYGTRPASITTVAKPPLYKGIIVSGLLNLHGKRYYRTWTRLAQQATAGDTSIVLQHRVNWEYGQALVLVTTAVKDSREWHQNEIGYVSSVTDMDFGGSMVTLQSPIQYTHYANHGYQAEVGLLSRMIVIQGSRTDSEPTDPDPLTCTSNIWRWGDYGVQCPNKELTGYGGHIMIYGGGKGFAQGIQLYRMGQTNVLGRYPFHFHVLGNNCKGCYLRDSSIYRSFYRCVSVHGTHNLTVSENVGYDVTGYCYYLEDGVEEDNTISFNLAAHIHYLGVAPFGYGQTTDLNYESSTLTLPADVTASGFYITNVHNNIIGNAASGGWSGFAFPSLLRPIGLHRNVNMKPSNRHSLTIDGNTVHSTGWYWYHAGGFYFGGSLYYDNNVLTYNAGRDMSFYYGDRQPCNIDLCVQSYCDDWCPKEHHLWTRITNSKAFLIPSDGLNSWVGRMEIIGFETHDVGLSMELLEDGIWIDNLLANCRSGETWMMPTNCRAYYIQGDGFFWYDTYQKHIMTTATFRNCGYKSNLYNQYDTSLDRGCDDSALNGCDSSSTAFGFLAHSDQFVPQVMQATRNITFQKCGRRFYLRDYRGDNYDSTVSGRLQNWLDADGSVSGFNEPTLIGSGQSLAGRWWRVDSQVVYDPQGPLIFIKKNNGPRRSLGHIRLAFDTALHDQVGNNVCGNGANIPCPAVGYIKHFGPLFANDTGLPITANPEVTGPIGGYGWLLRLLSGAPRQLTLDLFEIPPESPLILGISYPAGSSVTITAYAGWCYYPSNSPYYTCSEVFQKVSSHAAVRTAGGNAYFIDSNGFLTVRLINSAQGYTGDPSWLFPSWDTLGKWDTWYAIDRFSRGNITLPRLWWGPYITIQSNCSPSSSNSAYCATMPSNVMNVVICSSGYTQVAYDKCCSTTNPSICEYATG